MVLVRILIGKINDPQSLASKMREVPVINGKEDWNCVSWLQGALDALEPPSDHEKWPVQIWTSSHHTDIEATIRSCIAESWFKKVKIALSTR